MRSALLGMLVLAIVSACGLVYVRHQHRLVFVELQALLQQRDKMNTQWGQLLLEQSTFSFHHFVNTTARARLNMHSPQLDEVVVLEGRQVNVASKSEQPR
jgi:cell division protein FtsL